MSLKEKLQLSGSILLVCLIIVAGYIAFTGTFPRHTIQLMHTDHDHTLNFILTHEGGVNHAGTYAGITPTSWHMWRNKQHDRDKLPQHVSELSGNRKLSAIDDPKADLKTVKRFYYSYFHDWHAWDVHPSLQLIYADFVVLSGSGAVRVLQSLVGQSEDGAWGPHTAAAVNTFNAEIDKRGRKYAMKEFERFDSMKRTFFKTLADKNPERYGQSLSNWLKRSDDLKVYMEKILQH